MPSLITGYNYDIFISYRQKDNKYDGWVTKFVDNLKKELEATFKEDVSVYFDENPHDRLQETHDVEKSLEGKLKCLIFIAILSQTYCDPNSYAWQSEFLPFIKMAEKDAFGKDIKLRNGNVASRILPIRIHDLEKADVRLYEKETDGVLRAIDFVFKTATGVSRPLLPNEDHPNDNLNKTYYRDQINKVANAIKEIIQGLKAVTDVKQDREQPVNEVLFTLTPVAEKESGQKKPFKLIGRKLVTGAVLLAIIIAVVLTNLKFFKKDKFKDIRDADGRISLAVMPFENLTGDTTLNWFQRGISSLLINGLGSSDELAVRDDQTMFEVIESINKIYTATISPLKAKEVAEKARAETYISGSFQGTGGKYRILANLIDTKSGNIICTNQVEGDLKSSGYLDLTDSLCNEIRDYLEIKALEQKADYDIREAYPSSAEAYGYFIEGVNMILNSDYKSAINTLKKAVEIDTTFSFASFYIAFAYNFGSLDSADIKTDYWLRKAYNTKERLPLKYQNWVSMWNACTGKNPQEIIRYQGLLEKAEIESRLFWLDVGVTYSSMLRKYDKAVEAFKKVEEISMERGNDWKYDRYYNEFSKVLLILNRPEEVLRICDKGLKINPENGWLLIYKGSSYVMLGDSEAVNSSISEIRSYVKKNNISESTEAYALGSMYLSAKDTTMAEKYYRKAYVLDPENRNRKANLAGILIIGDINIEEGLNLCNEVLAKYPDLSFWIHMKGLALHKLGRNQEALEILKELYEKISGYNFDLSNEIISVEKALANQKNN